MNLRHAIPRLWPPLLLPVLAVALWTSFAGLPWRVDESVHGSVIQALYAGVTSEKFEVLTMLPAYHTVMAALARAAGSDSPAVLRLLSLGLALLLLPALARLLSRWREDLPVRDQRLRWMQVAALPLVSPFLFMVYSDIPALALLIAGLAAWLWSRPALAAALLLLAVAFRFQNIAFVALLLALAMGARLWPRSIPARWRATGRSGPLLLAALLAAFGVFVWWNGGVAIGDAGSHPLGVYAGNAWLAALVGGWLFLPLAVLAPGQLRLRSPGWVLLALVAMLAFVLGFAAEHPFNDIGPDYFLRNRLLTWLEASPWHRLALAPLAGLLVLMLPSLFADIDGKPRWDAVAIALCAFSTCIPSWLVEQRYLIPLMVLVNIGRAPAAPGAEHTLLVWWALQSALLLALIIGGHAFP